MTASAPPGLLGKAGIAPVLEVDLGIDRLGTARREPIVSSMRLSLAAGETIGIVGESGSGKSMTAKAIIGLLPPTAIATGKVMYGGRNLLTLKERDLRTIRGREIGLIMQDPFTMLNPILRCGRILTESFSQERRLSRAQRRAEIIRRLAEVGIVDESVMDRYPFQLSGGMRQRVAIAAALARDPQVLIADEPSTALDVTTQRQILALIKSVQATRGMGLILITHDLRVAFAMCNRIYVLYAGSLVEVAPSKTLEREPLHPYSHGLLLSEPPADHRLKELIAIPGAVPAPEDVAHCCTFAPRCQWAADACLRGSPELIEVAAGRFSACIRISEIRGELASLRQRAEGEFQYAPMTRIAAPLVSVREVRKVFDVGKHAVVALQGVSIEVGRGESVGLVGESGSGKTTIARMLVGLEQPTSGELVIDGLSVTNWASLGRRDKRKLRSIVQVVFQDPYSTLNPMRTVGWTLGEAVTTHDASARRVNEQVADLLRAVGLPESYAQRRPVALSGGERQRVAIARALAPRPQLLICDEPVSALDVSVQAQVLNLFRALRTERDLAYLFITHDLSIVRQISDYLYVMHRGKVIESGATEAVLSDPTEPYTITLLESVPRAQESWLTTDAR